GPTPTPPPAELAPAPQPATPHIPNPARQEYDVESLEIMDENRESETYDVVAELAPLPAPEPAPIDDEIIEAVAGVPDEEAAGEGRRPRRKRRRRLRPGVDVPEVETPARPGLNPGVSNFVLLLIGLGALWFNLGALALLVPSLAVLPFSVGGALVVVGQ